MWSGVFDDRTIAALALADVMCGGTHALGLDQIANLHDHFSEQELAELILVAGQANLNNRAGNVAKQILGERT